MPPLNAKKALIFRITHIDNAPWILDNGLHCRNSSTQDLNFVTIGNPDVIDKRARKSVPISPCGTLADYVPFYFTPYSVMAYNIHTGWNISRIPSADIVILCASLRNLIAHAVPLVFTDRHAYSATAEFYGTAADLHKIDWSILKDRDFRRDYNDPAKFERYQAEALIYRHLPVDLVAGIVCYDDDNKRLLDEQARKAGVRLKILTRPSWYF